MRMRGYGQPRVLLLGQLINRIGIGGRYGLNTTRDISSLYFSYIIMEEPKINKAFAYRIHLMRMGQAKQPTVSYQAFCERLKK